MSEHKLSFNLDASISELGQQRNYLRLVYDLNAKYGPKRDKDQIVDEATAKNDALWFGALLISQDISNGIDKIDDILIVRWTEAIKLATNEDDWDLVSERLDHEIKISEMWKDDDMSLLIRNIKKFAKL